MTCVVGRKRLQEMVQPIIVGNVSVSKRKQIGFSYLAMLFIVAVLAVTLTQTYQHSDTIAKREKEKELFFIGNQYKQAINSYYNQSPDGLKELPKKIENLVNDGRFVSNKHHLRKRYLDPMTGGDWQLILDENNRIKGVYSASGAEILQVTLFEDVNPMPPNAEKARPRVYADIKFESVQEEVDQSAQSSDTLEEDATLSETIDAF